MNLSAPAARPDEGLIEMVVRDPEGRAGRAAASELLGRYQGRVYVWCLRQVRERPEGLDMARETLTEAWRRLPRFERRSRFTWWLFAIARSRSERPTLGPSRFREPGAQSASGTSTRDCPGDEALAVIDRLSRSDPRRVHVAECPHCRAVILRHEEFVSPSASEPALGYGPDEAAALDTLRHQLENGPEGVAPDPRTEGPWSGFLPRVLRPVMAFAAVGLVTGTIVFAPRVGWRAAPGLASSGALPRVTLIRPEYFPEDGVRLRWWAVEGADGYDVRYYSAAGEGMGFVPAGPDTDLVLPLDRLPEAYREGALITYRVHARRGSDEVAVSPPALLRMP
jgi:hypothetical protein